MPDDPYRYRDERGNLRLDELLGERCVRHYTRILESSSAEFAAMQLAMADAVAAPETDYAPPAWQGQSHRTVTPDGWLVNAEGAEQRLASSCQDLAVQPEICWDVCGYYQALGVPWKASRREIVQAQLRIDPGRNDPRVSYAAAQLLDPLIRRAYDLVPLGGVFMPDRDVQARIRAAAAMEASRRNAEAWLAGEEYDEKAEMAAVLKEWGVDSGLTDDEARERLAGAAFRHGTDSGALGSSLAVWERLWGWYLASAPYDDDPYAGISAGVLAELESWQAMIARALTEAGEMIAFAVGIWPGEGTMCWLDSKQSCIMFTSRGHITQEAAREAVQGYQAQRRNHRK